ncbi:BrxA family protein [Mycolicibacterium monacense]|uniref:BrxA family protein n=1 Tax=Mycolicibacterium monacense TaxID=85693 RepID=UPI0007EA1F7A|nr:BrxA family protein [Mycolicibacterium monacense]OBF48782.1 hypothetical protein A5778_22435 [Mycolicibacterium monacense]
MSSYNVNIQKGGALVEDSRRMIEVWDLNVSADENLERIASENLLGKTTRRRLDDILLRILRPRLVTPGPQVIAAMKQMLGNQQALTEALYYEAATDDALLAAFAEGPLFDWYQSGRTGVTIDDVTNWLAVEAAKGNAPEWTPTVRTKVSRGLLAALRDFGVLDGAIRKTFAPPRMTLTGFCYVAYRLRETGASARRTLGNAAWQRWLLDPDQVNDLFSQASQTGVLSFGSVGSSIRIDWHVDGLEEVVRAAA